MPSAPDAKTRYEEFCETTYVPIYSKPWWMDAVCGSENWDVWLFEQGGEVAAAMPYYLEERARGRSPRLPSPRTTGSCSGTPPAPVP